jgi:hypothetical protein
LPESSTHSMIRPVVIPGVARLWGLVPGVSPWKQPPASFSFAC